MDKQIKEVKETIRNAFGDLQLESVDLAQFINPEVFNEAEQFLQRKRFSPSQSLYDSFCADPLSVLETSWRDVALDSHGYRSCLPVALLRDLDGALSSEDIMRRTLGALWPDANDLYYRNGENFKRLTSVFTPDQHRAVCSFLELAFDTYAYTDSRLALIFNSYAVMDSLQYSTAYIAKWGWNQHEHSMHDKSRRYYAQLHNYRYPTAQDSNIAELLTQIMDAFAHVLCPEDHSIFAHHEPLESAKAVELRGLDWRTLHPRLLARIQLGAFSDQAQLYFLPAFMRLELLKLGEISLLDILVRPYIIDPYTYDVEVHGEARAQFNQKMLSLGEGSSTPRLEPIYTSEQRKAIVAYLDHCAAMDERKANLIRQAQTNHWV